ncbi:MAG: hypothetical protein ABEJ48_08940 [Halobacteriales archaeon]
MPVVAGIVLLGQSVGRILGSPAGPVAPWLFATLIGGIGATLVGVDHFLHRSHVEPRSVAADVTMLIPYGITAVSFLIGLSLHLA